MIFIASNSAPTRSARGRLVAVAAKGAGAFRRIRSAEEDGARLALGTDPHWPMAELPGTAMEHLARIALS